RILLAERRSAVQPGLEGRARHRRLERLAGAERRLDRRRRDQRRARRRAREQRAEDPGQPVPPARRHRLARELHARRSSNLPAARLFAHMRAAVRQDGIRGTSPCHAIMRRVRRLALLLAACSGAPARPPAPPPGPEALGGFWELADGSHVVMQVTLLGDAATVDAWASDTGQRFEIGGVSWDGRMLRATFTYPPTPPPTPSPLAPVTAHPLP